MEKLVKKYIDRVENAIDYGLDQLRFNQTGKPPRSKLSLQVINLEGWSTPELKFFLNELVKPDTRYLEIGVHRGSTFISAMYQNKFNFACAIDQFDPPYHNDDIIKDFLTKCRTHKVGNFLLIRNDSFNLKDEQRKMIEKVNTYFYDGGHTKDDHEKALTYYIDNLADTFIFIVDDWAHDEAREGTMSAIKKLNLTVHKEWDLGHQQFENRPNELSWHNRLYIGVMSK